MQKNYNSTAYREELRRQILVVAMPLFKKNGVKSVKMDDIAAEMGISKRTLYELYSNKEDLLYECVKSDKQKRIQQLSDFSNKASNEMAVISYFYKLQLDDLGTTNPVFFTDILKYTKTVEFLRSNKLSQKKYEKDFFKRGVAHGFFRNDVNYDILDELGDAAMQTIMQSKLFLKHPLSDIFRTFMLIFTRTCCTDLGQRYMESFFKENKVDWV